MRIIVVDAVDLPQCVFGDLHTQDNYISHHISAHFRFKIRGTYTRNNGRNILTKTNTVNKWFLSHLKLHIARGYMCRDCGRIRTLITKFCEKCNSSIF